MGPWEKFPSFESAFAISEVARVGHYLTLLHPSDDTGPTIVVIKECIRRSGPNLTSEVQEMLAQANWRVHLVAAVALLVTGATTEQLEILWSAIERPSGFRLSSPPVHHN